jgi:hypothetical protein
MKIIYQIIALLSLWILIAFGIIAQTEYIYKKGQIDAINGDIKFELNKDSCRNWVEIY